MPQYTIAYMKTDKKEIKGKQVDNIQVKLVKDGKDKWENINTHAKCYSAVAVCNVGDVVDVAYEKNTSNGKDYFNVVGFTRVASGATITAPSAVTSTTAPKAYGAKSDDTQRSICRQSSNTAAMNFVVGLLANGVYGKKATPDELLGEVKRFAKSFEAYVTLSDDYDSVACSMESIIPSSGGDDEPMF